MLFFWTREQLETLANEGKDEKLQLRGDAGPGVAAARLDGISKWPVLCFRDENRPPTAALGVNEQAMIRVGAASGLLVLALALGAALVARNESRLARMRTDLAASVAHELRTPLAGQRLVLESLLARADMPDNDQRDYLDMALRENVRLGRLAEEFLTFSRLERGVLELRSDPVSLARVTDEALESLRKKWEPSEYPARISIPPDLPPARADEQALITAVGNLLENAWKYSGKDKSIEVTAGEDADDVWLSVRDRGIGIKQKELKRIFRQYYRIDRRLARDRDGLGIGLSIVRRLVESMHGRVSVESEPGKGSVFTIRLPKES